MKSSRVGMITFYNLEFPFLGEVSEEFKTEVMQKMVSGEMRLILDFRSVPYIDSEGLEVLYDVNDEVVRRGGSMKIVNLNDVCNNIFNITRSGESLEVFVTVEEAGKSFL